ncbi:hypothetical protein FRC08_014760 [Ceratobasidium sp. 394]|nr:hypothetical protein FRC08_014760 [Ceratobasidium sp. 394]
MPEPVVPGDPPGAAPAAPVHRKPGRPRKSKPATANQAARPAQVAAPAPPVAVDEHGNHFPPPPPAEAPPPPPPPPPQPAPAPPANNSNYRDEEVRNLLLQISKFTPYTDDGWNKVLTAFNQDTTFPPRTLKSLMEKFRKLKDMKKPTGNPQANVFHQKALECEREIHALTSTFGVNDEHASDEDIEIMGFQNRSPKWKIPGLDDISSDSDVQVLDEDDPPKATRTPAAAYVAASSKSTGKRKASLDQPQRAAPIARLEPTKVAAPRTSAGQLHQGLARLVENTSPQVEKALNNQRHQDDMTQIHFLSLVEEVRTLRAQLDTERERRAELQSKLQRYELLDEMRRLAATGPGFGTAFAPGHFVHPHPAPQPVPHVAPVVPNVPVNPPPVPQEHLDPQLFP